MVNTREDLRIAIQTKLFEVTYAVHEVVVRHSLPADIEIEIGADVFQHANMLIDFAMNILPIGCAVRMVKKNKTAPDAG
jgi:ornithine carbamoyltransferase